MRDYWRAQGHPGGWYGPGWYGPWGWWGGGWFWGAVLVLVGAYWLLQNLDLLSWLHGDVLWPLVIILLGVYLIVRRGRGSWP
jgi:cell wall-active antibiotic response 4TMS protein YvqF